MHFTFVGNIDPAVVNPLLIKYLGSLPAQPTAHNFKDNGVRPVKGVVEANIKKGKEAKSMINLFWSGETEYSTKESMTLRALVEVLNIQITEKLREEMGGMYSGGLQGGMQKRPYAHYEVMAVIPTGPDKVEKLSAALMELITTARKNGIEQQYLDKVKETWKKDYRTHLQDNEFWLGVLSNAFIDQKDPEAILSYEQQVNTLTPADLQKAANKFLGTDNYIKVVLYPETATVK